MDKFSTFFLLVSPKSEHGLFVLGYQPRDGDAWLIRVGVADVVDELDIELSGLLMEFVDFLDASVSFEFFVSGHLVGSGESGESGVCLVV